MAKVSEIMTKDLVQVDSSKTVYEAVALMNKNNVTGVIVSQKGKPVGMFTERSLLKRFVPLNRFPKDVKVGDLARPIFKIDADASTKEAAKKILQTHSSRLGVFKKDKLVGWVTLTDLSRESSKNNLLDVILRHNEPEPDEFLCPECKSGTLQKVTGKNKDILRWECTSCGHLE